MAGVSFCSRVYGEYELQSRLLRVLEDGRVRRVGETRDRPVDVRVISATHTDLEAAVREKRFREDLYFRLAHLPIRVPPLRARRQDIRLLFEHFVSRFCRQQRRPTPAIEESVFEALERHSWPGNEKEYIERVLRRTGWNVAAAARLLHIQRTYLHQKLSALGSQRPGSGADSR